VIDAFVDELGLAALGFERVQAACTGRCWQVKATIRPEHEGTDVGYMF